MNEKEWQKAKEQILKDLDEATEPDKMTSEEALDCLRDFIGDIEGRIDGLKDDIASAAAEEDGS